MSRSGDRRSLEVRRQISIFDEIEAVQYRTDAQVKTKGLALGWADAERMVASSSALEMELIAHAKELIEACAGTVFADAYLRAWVEYLALRAVK